MTKALVLVAHGTILALLAFYIVSTNVIGNVIGGLVGEVVLGLLSSLAVGGIIILFVVVKELISR
jgi:hypothetical protein